jgi:D-glycero-alpha-D-manno-heptose-7-phosphate kinase
MIIVRTPHRLSLLGGGSDYEQAYRKHGGAVLVSTINRYSYVSLRKLPPYFEHKTRVAWSKIELVNSNLDIEHPGIRGVLEYLNDLDSGLEIHYDSDIPARAGMGSSSSFIVGLLKAYWHLSNDDSPSPATLAKTAIRVEREYVGDTVGTQDQIAVAYGGINFVAIEKDGHFNVRNVGTQYEFDARRKELESRLLLVFTGFTRHASEIAKAQVAAMDEYESATRELAEMATVGAAILEDTNRPLSDLFKLIGESWQIKRRLSPLIVNDEINALDERLMMLGAEAVKLIGAGGGGYFLVCCKSAEERELIANALNDRITIPVKFSMNGSEMIFKNGD